MSAMGRYRRSWILLLISAFVAGCANQSANQAAKSAAWEVAYNNAVAASGENEALDALVARLRVSCNLPAKTNNLLPALPDQDMGPFASDAFGLVHYESADTCARSRVVAAFNASEGEPYCMQRPDTGTFVACIINGAFATQLAKKLGLSVSAAERWNDAMDGDTIHKALFDKTFMRCWGRTQSQADRCAEDIYLPLFDIERKDIGKCPKDILWGMCIGKAGLAKFVNGRLTLIS